MPHGAVDDLLAGAAAAGCLTVRVDLAAARSKDDLLAAIGKALRFPDWFGHNLDALTDCLADMGWLPAEGYVVILEHCDGIHARAENDFLAVMQAFQDVAVEWSEQGLPFWCLVDMQADGIAWLPTIARTDG